MSTSRKQFNATHAYLEMVAEALAREGHTMQDVVKAIRRAEITPTKNALKEVVWKPLLKIISGKDSTTKQDTKETQKVFDAMNKWLGQEFELHVPWPSEETKSFEQYENYIENTEKANNF